MTKISIIVPLYYGSKYLNKINSMVYENIYELRKIYPNIEVELIYINDSPDEHIFEPNNLNVYTNKSNLGVHASRICGLHHSKGEYILFLDQDDEIAPNYLLSQLQSIDSADAVVCNGYYRNHKLIYEKNKVPIVTRNNVFMLKYRICSPGQVLIKKSSIPKEWKKMILTYSGADDFLLWLLMAVTGAKFRANNTILYTHIENGANASFNWTNMINSLKEMMCHIRNCTLFNDNDINKIEHIVNSTILKSSKYAELESKWNSLHIKGKTLGHYFKRKNIHTIAVYGYGIIGDKVIKELQEDNIQVAYVIDKDPKYQNTKLTTYSLEDDWPHVELIIVTPIFAYEEIKQLLLSRNIKNIVSVDEIFDMLLQN